jgi:hypothetical protein
MSEKPISDLRRRMLEDMAVRKFGDKTRHDYIRHVEAFTRFLGRSPDTADLPRCGVFPGRARNRPVARLTEAGASGIENRTSARAASKRECWCARLMPGGR